jgi:hypothetical protein
MQHPRVGPVFQRPLKHQYTIADLSTAAQSNENNNTHLQTYQHAIGQIEDTDLYIPTAPSLSEEISAVRSQAQPADNHASDASNAQGSELGNQADEMHDVLDVPEMPLPVPQLDERQRRNSTFTYIYQGGSASEIHVGWNNPHNFFGSSADPPTQPSAVNSVSHSPKKRKKL